jgi:hypothetical protein
MGVTLGSTTLVSDTQSNALYGQFKLTKGTIQEEVYERDFPRADGVMEVSSGNRRRIHILNVLWHTSNEDTVDTLIDGFIKGKRYFTLTVTGGGFSKAFPYCRLMAAEQVTDGRLGGNIATTNVLCYGQRLIFKQVVV